MDAKKIGELLKETGAKIKADDNKAGVVLLVMNNDEVVAYVGGESEIIAHGIGRLMRENIALRGVMGLGVSYYWGSVAMNALQVVADNGDGTAVKVTQD